MAIVYPDNLPAPLLNGYGLKRQQNIARTKMVSGRPRYRKPFLRVPTRMPVTWVMPAAKAELFEGFVEHALDADWFQIHLLTPNGLVLHRVRLLSDPRKQTKLLDLRNWQYQANLEVETLS